MCTIRIFVVLHACTDGDDEKAQFLRKLARLRKQSSIFLRMLNDMRRRLKELQPEATTAKSYKYGSTLRFMYINVNE